MLNKLSKCYPPPLLDNMESASNTVSYLLALQGIAEEAKKLMTISIYLE